MLTLLKHVGNGFAVLVKIPLYVLILTFYFIYSLLNFIIYSFKNIYYFTKGKSLSKNGFKVASKYNEILKAQKIQEQNELLKNTTQKEEQSLLPKSVYTNNSAKGKNKEFTQTFTPFSVRK